MPFQPGYTWKIGQNSLSSLFTQIFRKVGLFWWKIGLRTYFFLGSFFSAFTTVSIVYLTAALWVPWSDLKKLILYNLLRKDKIETGWPQKVLVDCFEPSRVIVRVRDDVDIQDLFVICQGWAEAGMVTTYLHVCLFHVMIELFSYQFILVNYLKWLDQKNEMKVAIPGQKS